MHQQSTVLADAAEPPEQGSTPQISSNYFYPEFAGPSGERYLKKLLRQVLPMALYRTWEIFTDHQARGNDCYLSISQLAVLAGRSLRTMQKNMASLQARQLLIERIERKAFRGPQGEPISRMVVVKDFANLYALAHEYHEWLHTATYIAPDRAFVETIMHEPLLVEKLRRFDNYRRVLYTRLPGPGPREQEENLWFTEYHPEHLPISESHILGRTREQQSTRAIPPKLPPKDPAKEMAKDSPKRISESSQRDVLRRDSFDSAASFSISSFENADAAIGATQTRRTSRNQVGQFAVPSQPPDHPLARSFVNTISMPFGDRNKKGSTTRVLKIISNAYIEDAEILLCLVRAYVTAHETRALRPEHYDQQTGQANRMPLFCTLFERFVQARALGKKWDYSWQQMEEAIAADKHLALWRSEYQRQANKLADNDIETQKEKLGSSNEALPGPNAILKHSTVKTFLRPKGRTWLSQTENEREERAARARKVYQHLFQARISIQEPIVLWEHLLCGCPLYHKRNGKEVCALCSPDPDWSEEVVGLIHSIVETKTVASTGSEPQTLSSSFITDELLLPPSR